MLAGERLSRRHGVFGLEVVLQLALDDELQTQAVTAQPDRLLS